MKRRELKAQAKVLLRGHWGKFALCTLLMSAFYALLSSQSLFSGVENAVENSGFSFSLSFWDPFRPWLLLVYVACQILTTFLFYGYWDQFLKARIGSPVGLKAMCKRFAAMPGKIVGATCINFLWTFALSFAVYLLWEWFGGFALPLVFIILIFFYIVTIRLSMVPIILLENPYTTVPNAFIQSYNLMRGFTRKLFVLDLSFIGWILLSFLTCGIALLWILPYRYMTVLTFYYDIKAKKLNRQEF